MINHQDFSNMLGMKRICLIMSIMIMPFTLLGQKSSLKKANKLFEQKSYVEAAKAYETLKPNQEVLQKLGDAYYFNSEMKLARVPYARLFNEYKDSIPKDVYFRYAQTLKGVKDFKKADEIMGDYLGYAVDTQKFIENLNRIVPYNYEVKRMSQSARTGDFGMSYFGDKVVFSSLRNSESPTYNWNALPYLDLYQAEVSKDEELKNIKPFPKEINTSTHESNATFTTDGKTMYFSRTSDKRVLIGNEMVATVKLFRAELIDTTWTNVMELPFSSENYSTEHPVLSKDNSRLYFSSDMPGTVGSFDIFYVELIADSFGAIVHLDETINTKHREQFPFVDADNTLYFASDGHQGIGGLDIFMSKMYTNRYSKPLNLGETINSEMDDFGYILNEKTNKGYFSSNRSGTDNLYSFVRTENERQFTVEGDVRDKNSKNILPGTTVTLYDDKGTMVGQMVVGEDAQYVFNTEPNKTYTIEGYRNFYVPKTETFTTNDDGKIVFSIELEIESYDDAEDLVVTKDDGYIYIELENIYFDFNKWDIKPQAAKTLDVLVGLLKKYPRMEIQLGAHTDSRASDLYNLQLSQNRAAAAVDYLVYSGIERTRLRSKGYGERVPLVNCGDNCNEEEHSINRRCEFLILR